MRRSSSGLKGAVLIAFALLELLWLASAGLAQANYNLRSPDQRIEISIQTGGRLSYSVLLNGKALLQGAMLSLKIDQTTLGLEPKIKGSKQSTVDQEIEPVVRQKFARIREHYNELKLEIGEADVDDYPGLWLRGNSNNSLSAVFPPYPLKEELSKDRDFKITQAADYIAITQGTRTFPWRLIGIAEKDGDLITNQLVYLLAKPSQVQDTSWIKPGKVAWDWYNANNIYGVNFKSGINTQTYKYYIDFASKYGIEYRSEERRVGKECRAQW